MEYNTVKIGSLIQRKRLKAKNYKGSTMVYAVTNNRGFVKSEDLHDFKIHSEDTSNYSVVEKNDFAYNPSRLNIGSIAYFRNEEAGIISPMYVVFSIDRNIVNPEYLFMLIRSSYVMQRIEGLKEEGARFRFDFKRWDNIEIKLPSLTEQKKIIDILDSFTAMITNLETELASRQKQYEHYRNQLFGEDLETLIERTDCEVKTIGDLGTLIRGKRFVRTDIVEHGVPCVHYGDMYTYYGLKAEIANTHITAEKAKSMRFAQKGDVVIVGAGENDWDIGIGLVWQGEEPAAIHDACYILEHKQEPMYVSHFLRSTVYHLQLRKYVSSGKISSFSAKDLAKILIPVPSLQRQKEIVEILDTFEALITNIKQELEARKKQYEYYREKLLTFE